jgi:hypothetical protein
VTPSVSVFADVIGEHDPIQLGQATASLDRLIGGVAEGSSR